MCLPLSVLEDEKKEKEAGEAIGVVVINAPEGIAGS